MRMLGLYLTITLVSASNLIAASGFMKQDSTEVCTNDSVPPGNQNDTISNGAQQESDFQNYLDTLYHNNIFSG